MKTWGDVLKTLIVCAGVLFLFMAVIWAFETDMEIKSLQEDMEDLKAKQRPLVKLQGKYLNIFTNEKEIVIETRGKGES